MIPILNAIQNLGVLAGGSTKPWLVLTSKAGKPVPFIVKIYNKDYVEQYYTVAKEVYCSVLAELFGLKTPPIALVNFSSQFVENLHIKHKMLLSGKHNGLKFGTEEISPCFQFQEDMTRADLWKYDLETVYAFDTLIKNGDRRVGKPNILMKSQDMYIIDHENSFSVSEKTKEQLDQNQIVYWKERHIFYSFLKDRGTDVKRNFFLKFQERLAAINFDVLDPYFAQLFDLGHDTEENYCKIKDYLCYIQLHSEKFVRVLRGNLA